MTDEKASFRSRLSFIIITGIGYFADGYLTLSIGLVATIVGYVYFKDEHNKIPTNQGAIIKGGHTLGQMVGQIMFGLLGDTLGRRVIYGRELMLTMFGTLMCTLLPWNGLGHNGIVAWLAIWRIVTGVGIGGDYPMSSSLSAEKGSSSQRARLVLLPFLLMSVGNLFASVMLIILLTGFKHRIESDVDNLEWVWRLLLGLAIVPCALTVYSRLTMRETKYFEKYVKHTDKDETATQTRSLGDQLREFRAYFSTWEHGKRLMACCLNWFLYDIAFYGVNLNQATILTGIGFGTGKTPYTALWNIAVGNVIVQASGYLVGMICGVFLPDLLGRKRLQMLNAAMLAIVYVIWAGVQKSTGVAGLMTLFAISQFLLNCGLGATSFLYPLELFPTRVRATAHGISAASGKAGAVITTFAFGNITNTLGIQGALGLFAFIMALIVPITFFWLPETKGRTLDELENESPNGTVMEVEPAADTADQSNATEDDLPMKGNATVNFETAKA